MIEMNEEGLIAVLAQDLLDKPAARVSFFAEHLALAQAGIDQQTQRERKIGFASEITDVCGRPSSARSKSSFARSETILPCLSRTVASTLTTFTSVENFASGSDGFSAISAPYFPPQCDARCAAARKDPPGNALIHTLLKHTLSRKDARNACSALRFFTSRTRRRTADILLLSLSQSGVILFRPGRLRTLFPRHRRK